MLHQLAQQWMTLSDIEWLFNTLHAISAVAELLATLIVSVIANAAYLSFGTFLNGSISRNVCCGD